MCNFYDQLGFISSYTNGCVGPWLSQDRVLIMLAQASEASRRGIEARRARIDVV